MGKRRRKSSITETSPSVSVWGQFLPQTLQRLVTVLSTRLQSLTFRRHFQGFLEGVLWLLHLLFFIVVKYA